MKTLEFRGVTVEYDETCIKSWKWHKALASGDEARIIKGIERLFCGKDEEVADALGDDFDVMGELIAEVTKASRAAKNSGFSQVQRETTPTSC